MSRSCFPSHETSLALPPSPIVTNASIAKTSNTVRELPFEIHGVFDEEKKEFRSVFDIAVQKNDETWTSRELNYAQANAAISACFSEKYKAKLDSDFVDVALVAVDVARRFRVNQDQFEDAMGRVRFAVEAALVKERTELFEGNTSKNKKFLSILKAKAMIEYLAQPDRVDTDQLMTVLNNESVKSRLNLKTFLRATERILGKADVDIFVLRRDIWVCCSNAA